MKSILFVIEVCFNKLSFFHLNLSVTFKLSDFFSTLSKFEKLFLAHKHETLRFMSYNQKLYI